MNQPTAFAYQDLTPDEINRLYAGTNVYIEHFGDMVIYYGDSTKDFHIYTTGVYEVVDAAAAERDVAALAGAMERLYELEMARGHGAVWMRRPATIQARFAKPLPAVPDDLPYRHPAWNDESVLIHPSQTVPGHSIAYCGSTQRFWLHGSTGYGHDHLALQWLRGAFDVALQMDEQRRSEGLSGANEVRERFHVPYPSEVAR